MRAYIIRRLLLVIPTVFLVSVMIFFIIRLIPGDVVDVMISKLITAGWGGVSDITEMEARTQITQALGMDVPILTQYGRWVGVLPGADGSFSGLLQGDLGHSIWRPTTVAAEIARRWPVTLELGLLGVIIGQLISLPVGIYSALRQDTWGDYIGRNFAIIAMAIPAFWLATMVIIFPAIWWGYMPPIMHVPFLEDPMRNLTKFIVPATILGMSMAGVTMRMTRTMMLEVMRQDYIRTAWAKGLRERVVILRHVLKNALIPVITHVGLWAPVMLGGTVVIEQVFVLPGMGLLILEGIAARDYPIVSGAVLFFGFGMVLINLVIDLTYAFLDPRIRYK